MTRTFIALELRESLKQYLGEIIDRLARELPSLRWVDPAGIHLTLAFLGELNGAQLSEATATAEIAAQQVSLFSYHLSHLGTFGSARQPSVVWVGIDEGLPGHAPWSPLRNLHRILNEELAKRGFEVDR